MDQATLDALSQQAQQDIGLIGNQAGQTSQVVQWVVIVAVVFGLVWAVGGGRH